MNLLPHKEVAYAFIGPRPEGYLVCHYDDDKSNNSLSNLYYGTHQDNSSDASRNGKILLGGAHARAIFTDDQVLSLRQRVANGERIKDLCKELDAPYPVMLNAVNGVSYIHLPNAQNYKAYTYDKAEMVRMVEQGSTIDHVASIYGFSAKHVANSFVELRDMTIREYKRQLKANR